MAITRIGNPAIADQRGVNFRNIIINGGMDVAQRGTSFTGITATQYTVDRQRAGIQSAGTWTISQSTDVPSGQGFAYSLKWDCTTADASLGASDVIFNEQRIEGQNLQYLKKGTANAKSLTVSFWVKSNKTGTYIFQLNDTDNNRSISKSYTINSASTWEKKTITYDGDTTGAFVNDNGQSLRARHWLAAGSDHTSGTLATSWESRVIANEAVGQVNLADSTSNEWYITGVQLEAGQVASDFEFLPFDVNLQRCQRYYQQYDYTGTYHAISHGTVISGNQIRIIFPFINTMRSTPSLSNNGVGNFRLNAYGSGKDQTCTGMSLIFGTVQNAELNFTKTTSNLSTNTNGRITTEHTNDASLIFNAEL